MSLSTELICTVAVTSAVAGIGVYYLYKCSEWKQLKERKLKRIMSIFETNANCEVKDGAILHQKISTLLDGGKARFQILTDFDRTLTKAFIDCDKGHKGHSSFQVIENSSYVGGDIAEELHALHAKYYPIEMSPTIPTEEKTPLMIEWYKSSFNLGVKFGVKKALLPAMVKESHVMLRDGMGEFLRHIQRFNVPMLVVSAGLGDVIDEVFTQQTTCPPQVSVMANYYEFDSNGVSVGLKGTEMLHTFNKADIFTLNQPYFNSNIGRSNAFVMGDTLGDPNMTDNVEGLKCLLKIGFLNDNIEASLDQYLSVYDIVLTGDAPMDVITVLIQELFNE